MHHCAVILAAEHAADDRVGMAEEFAAQIHGKLTGLHEIGAALFPEDFLGGHAAVLAHDADDELGRQGGAVPALAHDVEDVLLREVPAKQGAVGRGPPDDAREPPDVRAVLGQQEQVLTRQGQAAQARLLLQRSKRTRRISPLRIWRDLQTCWERFPLIMGRAMTAEH